MPSTHRYTWNNTKPRVLFVQDAMENNPIDAWVSFFWPDCTRKDRQSYISAYTTAMWKRLTPAEKQTWRQCSKDLRSEHNLQKPQNTRPPTVQLDMSNCVIQELVAWRKSEASAQRKSPSIIIKNATIHDIATKLPTTLGALLDVNGIGRSKLNKYGRAILHIVQQSC